MDLVELWKKKYQQGEVRFDPDLIVVRSTSDDMDDWGTVYYSQAREKYKDEVVKRSNTSFDLNLMGRMHIADFGGLVIAANPNSLFQGHFVIYPRVQSREFTLEDLTDITSLAALQPDLTFIHNAESSAASIVDWVHFQAYAIQFPIEVEETFPIAEADGLAISTISEKYPAYAIRIDGGDPEQLSSFLFKVGELLSSADNPQCGRIPLNYIWSKRQVWIVPRARGQSERAARYFGGLEIGGLFCLPNSSEFSAYLRPVLKAQVEAATLRTQAERNTRAWFEESVIELLNDSR